ncbi:MAG TPA: hypothetical protein DIW31_03970 [Bacteroidales bacterium]|nr:hypothetical protein [Bacteroidales bacterium]
MIKSIIIAWVLVLMTISWSYSQTNLKDIDGNIYKTIVIGNYEWMAENLKVTHYNTGEKIKKIEDKEIWKGCKSGAYCWYNNIDSNKFYFGALYNWYAVNTQNLCPDGWRVPSDEEWKNLESFVDSIYKTSNPEWNGIMSRGSDVGLKLKAKIGWNSEGGGTDIYKFSALPYGERSSNTGNFHHQGNNGFWWSSTDVDTFNAWYRCLVFFDKKMIRNIHPKAMGFSVRCIKEK